MYDKRIIKTIALWYMRRVEQFKEKSDINIIIIKSILLAEIYKHGLNISQNIEIQWGDSYTK